MKKLKLTLLVVLCVVSLKALGMCNAGADVSALAAQKAQKYISPNGRTYLFPDDWFSNLDDVRTKIDIASGIKTRLLICDSEEVNAFSANISGENVTAINLGVYKLLSSDWDAYAALLGHENAHLVKKHTSLRQDRSWLIALAHIVLGTALEVAVQSNGGSAGTGADISSVATDALSKSYSREDELEADKLGLEYSYYAGFNPNGAIRLYDSFGGDSNFLSTHPSSATRVAKIEELIKGLPAGIPRNKYFGKVEVEKEKMQADTKTLTKLEAEIKNNLPVSISDKTQISAAYSESPTSFVFVLKMADVPPALYHSKNIYYDFYRWAKDSGRSELVFSPCNDKYLLEVIKTTPYNVLWDYEIKYRFVNTNDSLIYEHKTRMANCK